MECLKRYTFSFTSLTFITLHRNKKETTWKGKRQKYGHHENNNTRGTALTHKHLKGFPDKLQAYLKAEADHMERKVPKYG